MFSKTINSDNKTYSKIISSHIKANGGVSRISRTSSTGKTIFLNLGSFLGNISTNGISKALDSLNLKYAGENVNVVLSNIVDKLSVPPNSKEAAIARDALIDTLSEIYQMFDSIESLEELNKLSEENCKFILIHYVSNYIYKRFLNDLGKRLEMYIDKPNEAMAIEKSIKEYIYNYVNKELDDLKPENININISNSKDTVDEIYTKCYQVLENEI